MTRSKRASSSPKSRQLTFSRVGGSRPGAGRKPKGEKPGVSQAARERLSHRHPVHVTLRLREGLPSLRRPGLLHVLKTAFSRSNESVDEHGLRIVHFAIQSNHVHLLVEARDARSLSRSMQGLLVRIARNLNRAWRRKGTVFADRYHSRALRTPREVRNALVYVLQNSRKHGCHVAGVDPHTSGRELDGWRRQIDDDGEEHASALRPPRTWLLAHGWKRHGLIDSAEIPREAGNGRTRGSELLDMEALRRAARQPAAGSVRGPAKGASR
jgi:REP element-mobilizing transposase RayT